MNVVWLRGNDGSSWRRVQNIKSQKAGKRVRLTIVRSCCRWPCLQIYLQSFWVILDENAKVEDGIYGVGVALMVDASVSWMRGGRRMDGKKRL